MSDHKQYMLMEVVGDGPKFRSNHGSFDSWLCSWGDYESFLEQMLEGSEPGQAVDVRFTFLEMTNDELAAYCNEHEIYWE